MKIENLFYFIFIFIPYTSVKCFKLEKGKFRQVNMNTIPETLPSYSALSNNFTKYDDFKITMLNINVTRYEAKEV